MSSKVETPRGKADGVATTLLDSARSDAAAIIILLLMVALAVL
jgi:hypothetical protein